MSLHWAYLINYNVFSTGHNVVIQFFFCYFTFLFAFLFATCLNKCGIDIEQPFIAFENPRIYKIFVYFRFCAIFHDSLWKIRLSTRFHKENVSVLQCIVYLCGTVSFKSYQLFSDSENFYPELRL